MTLLLVFACLLFGAVLLSELASRSLLSSSVLFLVGGFAAARLGWIELASDDARLQHVAEVAIFAVLFTDGMRIGLRELREAWHLPGRALLIGMPLTLLFTATLAHYLAGLSWLESLLVGAVLAPTDPVFASAIVGREEVSERLRRLLNVESGLNDGLALPLVVVLLGLIGPSESHPFQLLGEVGLGIGMGIGVTWLCIYLESRRVFSAHAIYESLLGLAIALLLFALSGLTHANRFLTAFAGGMTVATVGEHVKRDFHELGEVLSEVLKLAALFLFGALVTPAFFGELSLAEYAFVLLVLLVVRPVALSVALLGSDLTVREWIAAAWFGPKGFASVVLAVMVLHSGAEAAQHMFRLLALIIVFSMIAHSSTDVAVARWLRKGGRREVEGEAPAPAASR